MKKILVFSNSFYPSTGGMEKNSHLLAFTLNETYDVTLLTKTKLDGGLEINSPFKIKRGYSLLSLIKKVINSKAVVVNGGVSLPIFFIAKFFFKKVIVVFQMSDEKPNNINLRGIIWYFKDFLSIYLDVVIGVSRASLESRGNISRYKMHKIIYNPIDLELASFTNLKCIKKYDILFCGRMIRAKGIFLFIDALKLIDEDDKTKVSVLMSGEGIDKNTLRDYINEYNFENIDFDFQGFVRGKKLANTYINSKCFVLPSMQHKEGSSLALAEAITFGCKVIYSDQPAMVEQMEGQGFSFILGDKYDLKNKLNMALIDNRDNVDIEYFRDKFSIEKYQKSIKEVFQDTI